MAARKSYRDALRAGLRRIASAVRRAPPLEAPNYRPPRRAGKPSTRKRATLKRQAIARTHRQAAKEQPQKPRLRHRRLARIALAGVLIVLLIPALAIPLYAIIRPPASTLMMKKMLNGETIRRTWVPLAHISRHVKDAVILSEDGRFCHHSGIDWREVENSLDRYRQSGHMRGASTLTMQTVKNLYLWPSRSVVRKAIEVPLAYYADLVWSKKRTLELYLNSVEWGPGIFGIEVAAQHYFNKSAARLGHREAALLAAVLPNPVHYSVNRPSRRTRYVANIIRRRMARDRVHTRCIYD